MKVIVAVIVFVLICTGCSKQTSVSDGPSWPAPRIEGVDQSGKQFTSDVLKGKPWVASFFFTTCESVCPALNAVQRRLVEEFGTTTRFVSISTDPQLDTGATLAEYAALYAAKPGSWWMINMPENDMRKVATDGFRLMDPKEPAMHSTRFVAVNKEGIIDGYFDSTDSVSMDKLKKWIHSQQ